MYKAIKREPQNNTRNSIQMLKIGKNNLKNVINKKLKTLQLKPNDAVTFANQNIIDKELESWDEVQLFKYYFSSDQWQEIVKRYNQNIGCGVKLRYLYDDNLREKHLEDIKHALFFKEASQTGAELIEYGNVAKTIMLGDIGELTGPAKTAVSIIGIIGAASVICGSLMNVISGDIYNKTITDRDHTKFGSITESTFDLSQILVDLAGGVAAISAEVKELGGDAKYSESYGEWAGYFLGINDILAILKEINNLVQTGETPRIYPLLVKLSRAISTFVKIPLISTLVTGVGSALLARDEARTGGKINIERKKALGKLD